MRLMRMAGFGLVAAGLAMLSGDAQAIDPRLLKKRPVATRPVAHVVVQAAPKLQTRSVVQKTVVAAKVPTRATAPMPSVPSPVTSAQAVADPDKPVLVALSGDWSVFAATKNGAKTCYTATQPKDTVPKLPDRSQAYVYLAGVPSNSVKHELTIKLGLAAPVSGVTANIDGRDFKLATAGDVAYPKDAHALADLLDAMRRGHTLLLRTTLASATQPDPVTDSISLLGIDDSVRLIDRACLDPANPG